jgi:hypothetical protein
MPRWWAFAPVAAFFGLIGVMALLYGKDVADLSETDVINHYAARYVAESNNPNASMRDCLAVPGTGNVWIVVRCAGHEYAVNRFGGLISYTPLAEVPPFT